MFEIGNSLREARLRQGFELPRVEADTKIRAKYLRSLEEERFDVLPGDTYVKGFLRTYAEYLGLDGQLYVDEYNSRFAREEELPAQSGPARPPSRPHRIESNFVVVALAGIVAVTILVVVAWKFGSSAGSPTSDFLTDTGSADTTTRQPATETSSPPTKPAKPAARLAKLVLRAPNEESWVEVRSGSAAGNILYSGTIETGQTQRFVKWKRLWVNLGRPAALRATLNGKRVRSLPAGPSIVLVTARGLRVISPD